MQQFRESTNVSNTMPALSRSGKLVLLMAFAITCCAPAFAQTDTPFDTGCGPVPFHEIGVEHKGVDDFCGIGGVAGADDIGNQKQNRAKNNFCLTGDPVAIRTTDMLNLQKKVDALDDFKFGSGRSVPKDRTPLKELLTVGDNKIGEGDLVTLVGFMMDPHYSDVKAGEGVNCKQTGNEPNDIHFSFSRIWRDIDRSDRKHAQAQLCNLVTGEVSPHFRPESWEVEHLSKLERIPVRLKGQLFFDASHVPCRPGKPVNPARATVWEIHPVYSIDVCKTKNRCRANVNSDWITMDAWVAAQHEDEESEKDQ